MTYIPKPPRVPEWRKATYSYSTFATAGGATATADINGFTIPAGYVLTGLKIRVTQAIAAPGLSNAQLTVDKTAGDALYAAAVAANAIADFFSNKGGIGDHSALTVVNLRLVLTGAVWSAVTAGSIEIHYLLGAAK